LGLTFQGKRDLYEALGYPQLNELDYGQFYAMYKRHDVASRIIDAPVDGCWQNKPILKEPKSDDTDFEEAWIALEK
jgi:hypothetical protein